MTVDVIILFVGGSIREQYVTTDEIKAEAIFDQLAERLTDAETMDEVHRTKLDYGYKLEEINRILDGTDTRIEWLSEVEVE